MALDFDDETAAEHIRNALALISPRLQVAVSSDLWPGRDVGVLFDVEELDVIMRLLHQALAKLDGEAVS